MKRSRNSDSNPCVRFIFLPCEFPRPSASGGPVKQASIPASPFACNLCALAPWRLCVDSLPVKTKAGLYVTTQAAIQYPHSAIWLRPKAALRPLRLCGSNPYPEKLTSGEFTGTSNPLRTAPRPARLVFDPRLNATLRLKKGASEPGLRACPSSTTNLTAGRDACRQLAGDPGLLKYLARGSQPHPYAHSLIEPQGQILDPLEWIARLTSHIPDTGAQTIHYYGAYINVCRSS